MSVIWQSEAGLMMTVCGCGGDYWHEDFEYDEMFIM